MEDVLDWIKRVDNYFEYAQTPEEHRVKLVAYKLNEAASVWWDQVQSNKSKSRK